MFEIDIELLELRPLEITDQVLDNISNKDNKASELMVELTGAHGCSEYDLDLNILCSNNYNKLIDYFNAILYTLPFNPHADPWLSTVGYWVGKVRENGDWDYKARPEYGPYDNVFCCRYGGNVFVHQTAEWIGNYNYGYTGSFLFSLDVLHFGSKLVLGMDPTDPITDWPAIDEGFYDAP